MFGARYNLNAGDRAIISGRECRLMSVAPSRDHAGGRVFQFEELATRYITVVEESEFLALYQKNEVRLLGPKERASDITRTTDGFTVDDEAADAAASVAHQKAWRRLNYTRAFDEAPVSLSTKALASFIAEVATTLNDLEPPSPGSLRRWLRNRGTTEHRRLNQMFGRHRAGSRLEQRTHPAYAMFVEEAEDYYDDVRKTPTEIWASLTHRINLLNQEAGSRAQIARPARSTVAQWLDRSMDFDRTERRYGRAVALERFGLVRGSMKANALLDIAIVDHTDLDCFIVDEVTGQPIGSPRLTVIIDSCSRMILGYSVGWKSASVEAVMAALRHAVKPKTYVAECYPAIKHAWVAYGQPRTIVVDQGLEFMGTTFEDVCATLGINIEVAPVRTPQYKGQVERIFETLNKQLVHSCPGSRFAKVDVLRKLGVDPQDTAVLTLDRLNYILHQWVVDRYSRGVHRTLGMAPQRAWEQQCKTDVIELCPDPQQLDRSCTIPKDVRLTKEGIRLHNLYYRSSLLEAIRRDAAAHTPKSKRSRDGAVHIRIRWDPTDIGQIFVMNPATKTLVPIPCVNEQYARNLNVHLHHRLEEIRAAENREYQSEAEMVAARIATLDLLNELEPVKVSDRKRLQRLRDPERRAQRDMVAIHTVDGTDAAAQVVATTHLPLQVPVAVNRDKDAPRESRPLLARKRRSPRAAKTEIEELEAQSVEPDRSHTTRGYDFAAAVQRHRTLEAAE
ncbi:Mu transposase C-terminal domain-containing protein [Brevundimonas vancanneytii]|uniref:Mu transposase C-terminal domain-containing protein n=1 Tax=Brevundimonas vancanneytii TaxID=1325724 RepID=UPI0034D72577